MKKYKQKIRINFYDCDPAGIMFFANIYKIAHSVYESFLKEISPDRDYFSDNEFILPIIHSEADYFSPFKYGDIADASAAVSRLKNSSFELFYEFRNNGRLTAAVKTVHVCADKRNFKKSKLPGNLSLKLNEYLAEE